MSKKNKEQVWQLYLKFQEKYEKIYGEKCICFMQVGSFYEIYSLKKEGYMQNVCDIMGIIVSNKNIGSEINPYMAGVPDHGVKKFLDRLIVENYTVVIIDQIGPKNSRGEYEKREVTKILSKSNVDIFFEINDHDKSESNNLLSIYIEEEKTLQGKSVISVGLSVIDLSTGINHIHEIVSNNCDVFEEMYRFIESHNPSEIIIHTKNLKSYSESEVINRINMVDKMYYYNFYKTNNEFYKSSYQENFLKKIFPNTGMLSVVQYLDLNYRLYSLNSYVLLLQYAYEKVSHIVNKIRVPQIYDANRNLNLYNNALYQLDVVSSNFTKMRYPNKFRSLFDVINKSSTALGKRELKDRLLNPVTNITELNRRYDLVDEMMNKIERYEMLLKPILDIEKYHRKMALKILQPKEYANLNESYENIHNIIELYEKEFMSKFGINIDYNDITKYKEYFIEYKEVFNVDIMINYGIKHIENSIFRKGLYNDIDKLQDELDSLRNYFDNLVSNFSEWIREYENKKIKKGLVNVSNKKIVSLIYQEKQGNKMGNTREGEHYLTLTKRRGDILKQILTQKKIMGFKFESHNKSDIKIVSDEIKSKSEELVNKINKMDELMREKYEEYLEYFGNKYNFNNIAKFIGEIDVIKSLAKVAKLYGYYKPLIKENINGKSFVSGKRIRHPIVERILMNTNYISNDICLSKDDSEDGILLFGHNGCGKTVYAKSVGLNIILAQMGSYVSAEEFEYYPYHHIFTRISGDDNIFYGQSSFAVEMNEMRSILKYANKNSLVLGDEVCRGTETISGLSIVASTLNKFSQNRINFIFATHLHQLYELNFIKELSNIKVYHLSVDTSSGRLVYERKLKDGPGDSIYGLEVAKNLLCDEEFIDFAFKIRNEIMNVPDYIVQPKSSSYNANIYINECQIEECLKTYKDEQLDVHHIEFQSHCNENGLVGHVRKNDKSNLCVLCKTHHIQVHNKDLEIYGYIDTEDGVKLDYKFIDKKDYEEKKNKRLKYGESDIKIIKNYKSKPFNYVIKELRDKHDINISRTTLNKIYNDSYK